MTKTKSEVKRTKAPTEVPTPADEHSLLDWLHRPAWLQHDGRRHSEFHYGSFARVITLPAGAIADDVKATYNDGILDIVVPIDAKRAEATRIPVTRT